MKSINGITIRRVVVALHRDLGYFFAGIVLIYAMSGILMNHRNSINPNYSVEISEIALDDTFPSAIENISDINIATLAATVGQAENLVKHYRVKNNLKLLFKGGSSLIIDPCDRTATYEHVSRRPVLSDMVRLHYNPGSWWTWFSDIFAISLIIITLTGLFIIKGKQGITGRGGLLLIIGIIVPIIFLLI